MPKTDPFEMFTNMFGMKNINPLDIHLTIDLELSDLYNGKRLEIFYEKSIPCNFCNGKGENSNDIIYCKSCNGKGKIIIEEEYNMTINRIIIDCKNCNGLGKFKKEDNICDYCNASGLLNERINDVINIPKGIPTSESITYKGKGHVHPNGSTGNLILNMNIKEHRFFHRKGSMLIMKKSIAISDALCGFTFYLQHLDKHILKINIPHGTVISPNSVFKLRGEGMPIFGKETFFDDLLIQFKIDFPSNVNMTKEQKNMLINMFPGISAMKGHVHFHREARVEEVNTKDSFNTNNCTQQ